MKPLTILQSGDEPTCSEVDSLTDLFVEGFFVQGWNCTMTGGDQGILLMFMTMIFGGVGMALFITTGSLAIPSVLGILLAGMLFAVLPATVVNLALVVLLLVLSSGGLLLAYRTGGI